MSDTEWFDKDLDDFDIPGYQPPSSARICDDFEADDDLDTAGKLNLLKLNFEDSGLPSSSGDKKQKSTVLLDVRSFLANESPDVLATILHRYPKGLLDLVKGDGLSKEFLSLSLQLLASVSNSSFPATKTRLLKSVMNDAEYWDQVYRALKKVLDSASRRNFSEDTFWAQNFYGDDLLVESVWKCLVQVLWHCNNETAASQNIMKLSKLLEKSQYLTEVPMGAQNATSSIFPSRLELLEGPENKLAATNVTTNSYLKRMLTLLREDFFLPIRKEIAELRRNRRCQQLRVYANARIRLAKVLRPNNQWNLFTVELQTPCEAVKDFMNGSLLIFTSSMEFPDLIFGVVGQNDAEILNKGFVSDFQASEKQQFS
jgi:hypothetical protein